METKDTALLHLKVGKKDVFVHITALQAAGLDGLDDGQAVNFEIEVASDGRESATNIQLA